MGLVAHTALPGGRQLGKGPGTRMGHGVQRRGCEAVCALRADESALAKLRVRYAPHLATAADRQTLSTQGPLERIARAIGENTRSLLRYFVRSR